jgi:hypothetical protein
MSEEVDVTCGHVLEGLGDRAVPAGKQGSAEGPTAEPDSVEVLGGHLKHHERHQPLATVVAQRPGGVGLGHSKGSADGPDRAESAAAGEGGGKGPARIVVGLGVLFGPDKCHQEHLQPVEGEGDFVTVVGDTHESAGSPRAGGGR